MPGLNGFEVAACIHEQMPDAEILLVTEHDSSTLDQLPQLPGSGICREIPNRARPYIGGRGR
jgi:hypothetical protein